MIEIVTPYNCIVDQIYFHVTLTYINPITGNKYIIFGFYITLDESFH